MGKIESHEDGIVQSEPCHAASQYSKLLLIVLSGKTFGNITANDLLFKPVEILITAEQFAEQ